MASWFGTNPPDRLLVRMAGVNSGKGEGFLLHGERYRGHLYGLKRPTALGEQNQSKILESFRSRDPYRVLHAVRISALGP